MRLLAVMTLGLVACAPIESSATPSVPNSSASATTQPSAASPTTAGTASPVAATGPQRSVVTFYRIEEVIRGSTAPAKRLDVNVPLYGMTFGPDPRWAITFSFGDPSPLRLLDLENGNVTSVALGVPSGGLIVRSFVRWLADGRLLLTGREVWLGGPRGEDLRSVFAQFPFEVAPSPSGKLLAIVTLGSSAIDVLDLASGNTTTLTGPFRPCVQDGGVGITWAPDERSIAATDCSDQAQGGMQTRFVRVADGQQTRSLPSLTILGWLPSGEIIARGPFVARDGLPDLWVVGVDGARRSIPSVGFLLSPDGRFLLGSVVRDAPTSAEPARRAHFAQLVEVTTGRVLEVGEGMPVGWTSRGEMVLVSLL
jgi:hypothetical protein